jgi:hypothetical protein
MTSMPPSAGSPRHWSGLLVQVRALVWGGPTRRLSFSLIAIGVILILLAIGQGTE